MIEILSAAWEHLELARDPNGEGADKTDKQLTEWSY